MNYDELEKQIIEQMTQEEKIDQQIEEASSTIAHELMASPKKRTRAVINDLNYSFTYNTYFDEKNQKNKLCIIVVDETKFKIALGKYRPATAQIDFDPDLTEEENLKLLVQGYIEFLCGRSKAEELDD